jgi:hypothetical protein
MHIYICIYIYIYVYICIYMYIYMSHKYILLLENYEVSNVLHDRYVSICILAESICIITGGEPTFGMPSLSLNYSLVVMGKKLTYYLVIFHWSILL